MAYTPSVVSADLPGGLNPSAFGSVGGAFANQTVLKSIFDYDPFSIIQVVVDRHEDMPMFRQMLRMQQAERMVSAPTTGHYEQDWKVNLVSFGTVQTAASGAGNPLVINMTASGMYNAGATVGGSGTNVRASNVRVGDVLQSTNGVRARVTTKNTTVNPHRITLTPLSSTDDLDTAFLANNTYAIFDNMWAEGSGIPEGLTPRVLKYTNEFQIVKAGGGSTGSELANQLFYQVTPWQDGNVFMHMKMDEMYRYERAMCYTLLFGTPADNLVEANATVGHDLEIKGTEGLIPFGETYGHNDTYTSGAYSLDDIDAMGTIFEQERTGTNSYICYQGYDIFQQMENAFTNTLANDMSVLLTKKLAGEYGVPSDAMQPFEDSDFDYYVGFRAVKKSGKAFYFRLLHEFSEYVGAGAPGYEYAQYNVVVPMGQTADKKAGQPVKYVSYEYKGMNNYRRLDRVGLVGGIGAAGEGGIGQFPVDVNDIGRFGILSEIAGHFACANKMIIQKPD